MSPYTILSAGLGSHEATALGARLSAWHDAMVAHERRLRAGALSDACDDECPHAEARALWPEAISTFGARAHELAFLRSCAQDTRLVSTAESTDALSEPADYGRARAPQPRAGTRTMSSVESVTAATEL